MGVKISLVVKNGSGKTKTIVGETKTCCFKAKTDVLKIKTTTAYDNMKQNAHSLGKHSLYVIKRRTNYPRSMFLRMSIAFR